MEDDLIEALIGLGVLVGICYLIYLFIVYVLPWVLFFGLVVMLPGWALVRLLTAPVFQLTARSAFMLFIGIPALTWPIGIGIVGAFDLPAFFSLFVTPSLYCLLSLIVLGSWGLLRMYEVYREVRAAKLWQREVSQRIRRLETQLEHGRLQIRSLEENHSGNFARIRAINQQIKTLCAQEPRTFGLLLNSLRTEMVGWDKSTLESKLRQARTNPGNPAAILTALVIEERLLTHRSGRAQMRLAHLQEQANRLQQELGHSQVTLQKLVQRVDRAEKAWQSFRRKPILL